MMTMTRKAVTEWAHRHKWTTTVRTLKGTNVKEILFSKNGSYVVAYDESEENWDHVLDDLKEKSGRLRIGSQVTAY